MLNILNNLQPFFEDTFEEISVRQYAKIINVSPPTASKLLSEYKKQNLLIEKRVGIYIFYSASKSFEFKQLSRIYWYKKLKPKTAKLHKKVILFGSLSKGENRKDSDIDLFIDTDRKIDFKIKSNRETELHFRTKNKHLLKNIEKGIRLW